MKILILCTGNSCRSQMAEGFFKTLDKNWEVFSAGTMPVENVNMYAIQVMLEIGIDISNNYPKNVNIFLHENFDFVITVCGGAKENCPVFTGKVKNNIHIGFDDPACVKGSEAEILSEFRRIRDEIKEKMDLFYRNIVVSKK